MRAFLASLLGVTCLVVFALGIAASAAALADLSFLYAAGQSIFFVQAVRMGSSLTGTLYDVQGTYATVKLQRSVIPFKGTVTGARCNVTLQDGWTIGGEKNIFCVWGRRQIRMNLNPNGSISTVTLTPATRSDFDAACARLAREDAPRPAQAPPKVTKMQPVILRAGGRSFDLPGYAIITPTGAGQLTTAPERQVHLRSIYPLPAGPVPDAYYLSGLVFLVPHGYTMNAATVSVGADGSGGVTFDGKGGRLAFFTNGACQGCTLPNVHTYFPHLTQVTKLMETLGYPAWNPPGLVLLSLWDGGHARLFKEGQDGGTVYGVALWATWGGPARLYTFVAATLSPAKPVAGYQRSPNWNKTYERWVDTLMTASIGLKASMP